MKPMLRAAIFDLDMCIFDTHSLGEHILDTVLEPLHASSVPLETQRIIDRELWTTSLEDIIVIYGVPQAVAEQMRVAHRSLVVPESARTFGDEEMIASLSVYRALVTSGYESWQARKIEMLGVARLFDEVVIDIVDDLKKRKGKRAIFAELAARHAWEPREVMVIGDNPNSELKAGRELGMITVQTLRPTVVKVPGFDHYVTSFTQLLPLIGSAPR